MDWFKRYGIPGVYCWGIAMLWFLAFHPINCDVRDNEYLQTVAGIIIVFFLPVGYFLSLLGQLIYHWGDGMGVDRKARELAGALGECNSKKEWEHEIVTISQTIEHIKNGNSNSVDVIEFVFKWLSKRMDMIVINLCLMLASVINMLIVDVLFSFWLFDKLNWRFNNLWYWVALSVSLVVFIVSCLSWLSLKKQISHIESKVFITLGIFKPDSQSANDQQLDQQQTEPPPQPPES